MGQFPGDKTGQETSLVDRIGNDSQAASSERNAAFAVHH
jgi:hypothetical protein